MVCACPSFSAIFHTFLEDWIEGLDEEHDCELMVECSTMHWGAHGCQAYQIREWRYSRMCGTKHHHQAIGRRRWWQSKRVSEDKWHPSAMEHISLGMVLGKKSVRDQTEMLVGMLLIHFGGYNDALGLSMSEEIAPSAIEQLMFSKMSMMKACPVSWQYPIPLLMSRWLIAGHSLHHHTSSSSESQPYASQSSGATYRH